MSISTLIIASLEQTVNGYLDMDPQAREQMRELHGRVIAFELQGLGQGSGLHAAGYAAGVGRNERTTHQDRPDILR